MSEQDLHEAPKEGITECPNQAGHVVSGRAVICTTPARERADQLHQWLAVHGLDGLHRVWHDDIGEFAMGEPSLCWGCIINAHGGDDEDCPLDDPGDAYVQDSPWFGVGCKNCGQFLLNMGLSLTDEVVKGVYLEITEGKTLETLPEGF